MSVILVWIVPSYYFITIFQLLHKTEDSMLPPILLSNVIYFFQQLLNIPKFSCNYNLFLRFTLAEKLFRCVLIILHFFKNIEIYKHINVHNKMQHYFQYFFQFIIFLRGGGSYKKKPVKYGKKLENLSTIQFVDFYSPY